MLAKTPPPPYYAAIFTTTRTMNKEGYEETAARMELLAAQQDGYLGMESAVNGDSGITISYWRDLDSIRDWKNNLEHLDAQEKGRKFWYKLYKTRIAKVERDYSFEAGDPIER